MKISFKWLSEYIELKDYQSKIEELGHVLTQAGLEVENIEDPSAHWDKVVVGHITKLGKHPDADRLTLCQVDIGQDEDQQIICGATNHKENDFVAVATPGAVLPGNFKIKKSKIRGVASAGMLCSTKELGLGKDQDGILILAKGLKPGTPFREVSGHGDIVFELNVTPNRSDCLSHWGLARELSTLLDRPLKNLELKVTESGENISQLIKVELKDSKGCPRYSGRMIRGVNVGDSPAWLKQRLESVGVNSINNIVDITNFVLFEFGQPLHAFDYDQLQGHQISIEKAKEGESFTSLDGTELKLTTHDLLIKDGKRAVALAGVVGGQNSGVSESTKDIFLESAFFTAEGVRKTSRHYGIETDACYRFSRGVDPQQTVQAMNRACLLIQEIAGGEIQKGEVDLYPEPMTSPKIKVKAKYVGQRLGYDVSDDDFSSAMERLGCLVEKGTDDFSVVPPSFRWDLSIPEDLVEEFGRLKGYGQIHETLPTLQDPPTNHTPSFSLNRKVQDSLMGLGVYQAINYAFIGKGQSQTVWSNEKIAEKSGLRVTDSPVSLKNPLSEELGVMRESLLPGLLKNAIHNDRHGVSWGRLFELGEGHFKNEEKYEQESRLGFIFWGEPEGLWQQGQKNQTVYSLKSAIEGLLQKMGGKSWRWQQVSGEDCPEGFHPGQAAQLFYEGKIVGIVGSLHPQLRSKNKIRSQVAWAEFNLDKILSRQPRSPKFKPVAKFPSVERDIALVAPEAMSAEELSSQIRKSAGPLMESLRVFDIYRDETLRSNGQKSIAFRLRFQSEKETLTDDVINPLRDKIVQSVCKKLSVESR